MEATHGAVYGDSGEGKTTLLCELVDKFNGLVVVCDHADKWPKGEGIAQLSTMRERLAKSDDRTDLVMVHRSETLTDIEHAANCMQIARDNWDTYNAQTLVVYDEADRVMVDFDKPSENPVAWGLHEGRDKAVKTVIATQDPQDLEYGPLKQCATHTWCGTPTGFHGPFLSHPISDAIDKDTVYELDRYEYVTFDKRGNETDRGETDTSYR